MARPSVTSSPADPGPDPSPGERSLPPRTPYEDAIIDILREVLGHSDIDVGDGLLALGELSRAPQVVAQIRRTMGVDVPVTDYVEARTVAGLAAVVAAKSVAARATARPQALGRRPVRARPVLSFDQQRLWLENQLLPGVIYNVHGRRRILGALNVPVLQESIRTIIARHETLRTRFPDTGTEPVQTVDEPDPAWRIRLVDVSESPDRAAEVERLLDEELTTPFDLATGPLIRCLLIRAGDTEHVLGVTMHHIVSDAWSIGLFIRELTALYRAGGDPGRAGLSALPVQYRDYAVWQRDWLSGAALESRLDHWRRHLREAPRVLSMPTVQRRTSALRAEAGQVTAELSAAETAALHELCRTHGVTSFMVLYAVLATVFGRWSGQSDIVVGVPVAGRNASLTDRIIGFFVNLLPLRVDLSGNPRFADLLQQVRASALDGYAHADAPMDELVRDLNVARDPRRTPLFEVVLNVVASPEAEEVSTLTIEPIETPSLFSRYDLTLTAQESGGVLRFKMDFPADRCDPPTGLALLAQVRTLLAAAVADPSVRLLEAPAEAGAEVGTEAVDFPTPGASIAYHAADPDRIAVVVGTRTRGYRWLDATVRQVAGLFADHGVTAGERVGVVRRPSAAFLAALLGAAAAGVIPDVIETDDPALTGPLELTTVLDPEPVGLSAAGTIRLTELPETVAPLSVAATPGTVEAPVDWAAARFGFGPEDRIVVLTNRSGYLTSAMCTAFAAGAALVIPDRSFDGDVVALTAWLRDSGVTVAYLDPPILRGLTGQAAVPELPALRCVVVDNPGDLLPHDIEAMRRVSPGCRCVAVHRMGIDGRPLTCYEIPGALVVRDAPLRVRLGAPLPGRAVTLRTPAGAPAAIGELAELWDGAARTGDLARRWPDGTWEYAGPVGSNPGFDPMETVSTLRDAPGVRDALIVEQREADGTPVLFAYVAGPSGSQSSITIQNYLRARLPDYLLPQELFVLDALPRTPWGEYQLSALPRPTGEGGGAADYAAPRTPMEEELTAILRSLLGLERVGIYDSFFELGGFSMLATRLVTRVRESFAIELAVKDIFESPTVDELARLIVRTQGEQTGLDFFEALLADIEQAG
ncbi:condensation domain-containing protein [Nocardia sp. BMG111209]|uniref:condensation domain-containing protein n=1 Tax=Nocardia sp. BMG111209 TaxID=1160137 RepID=UPI0003AABC9F|nr:condensation domain-containing protein [Nocardia sp. BMG111209]